MDYEGWAQAGAVSIPEPAGVIAPPVNPSICARGASVGGVDRTRSNGLRYALYAQDKGYIDLPSHEESASSSTSPRTFQVGKHGEVLGIEVDDALEISEQTEI